MHVGQGVTPLQAAEDGGPDQVLVLLGGNKRRADGITTLQQTNAAVETIVAARNAVVWLSSLVHRTVRQWWRTPQES